MPRKPKQEKQTITVIVGRAPVAVILHPPTGTRKSWYVYWSGLVASKSTGQRKLEDAIVVAENMVKSGGKRADVLDTVLSDDEFEEIQQVYFSRKHDPKAQVRAAKTLTTCLEAMRAFKDITELPRITLATGDECAEFQRKAVTLPKNWRQKHPRSKSPELTARVSPNTVLKWSRALQAAFERANRNAGKKCVRGVVPAAKLLACNPWNQFDWIEGRERPIRQFDAAEINALLDHFETRWAEVSVAPLLTKVFLWSSCRQQEVTSLRWSSVKRVGNEVHFEVVGKWGVERWVRISFGLFSELEAIRTDSDFVFAAYNGQLRRHHEGRGRAYVAGRVSTEFKPLCLGDWFADRLDDWSTTLAKGPAHTHVFRKTSLQYVRSGEDVNRLVAKDARVSESVLMTSYVKETDEQLRQASNRTFARIVASLPTALARRCGHTEVGSEIEDRLREAVETRNWKLARSLTAKLAKREAAEAS